MGACPVGNHVTRAFHFHQTADHLQMVGCLVEVKRARDMVANRTSAHHQVAISEKAKLDGAEERVALATAVN